MHDSYPASYYDDQYCLKPPLMLWVATLYLSRAITLPVAMAIGSFAGVDSAAIAFFRPFWTAEGLLPSAIAASMLYTLFRRLPSASRPVRWIWAHGRIILAISAVLDLVLASIGPIRQWEINDQTLISLCAAGFDGYFLSYILAARRVRHVFSEFPAPVNPAGR